MLREDGNSRLTWMMNRSSHHIGDRTAAGEISDLSFHGLPHIEGNTILFPDTFTCFAAEAGRNSDALTRGLNDVQKSDLIQWASKEETSSRSSDGSDNLCFSEFEENLLEEFR